MKNDKFLIESILKNIGNIERFIKRIDYAEFIKDTEKQFAVYKALENIGEAVKNLSKSLKQKYPFIEWREIAGMRDKLSHEYFSIKVERVWETVKRDVPKFKETIFKIKKNNNIKNVIF